ncbi:hypothetical protein HDU67_004209, partial [Dinochytrium kinnereticum]
MPPDEKDDVYFPLLDETVHISDKGLLALANGCKQLKVLSIRAGRPLAMPGITDACLTGMLELNVRLTELRLDPVNITFKDLERLPASGPFVAGAPSALSFSKLQVIEFGNPTEGFAAKDQMSA